MVYKMKAPCSWWAWDPNRSLLKVYSNTTIKIIRKIVGGSKNSNKEFIEEQNNFFFFSTEYLLGYLHMNIYFPNCRRFSYTTKQLTSWKERNQKLYSSRTFLLSKDKQEAFRSHLFLTEAILTTKEVHWSKTKSDLWVKDKNNYCHTLISAL